MDHTADAYQMKSAPDVILPAKALENTERSKVAALYDPLYLDRGHGMFKPHEDDDKLKTRLKLYRLAVQMMISDIQEQHLKRSCVCKQCCAIGDMIRAELDIDLEGYLPTTAEAQEQGLF